MTKFIIYYRRHAAIPPGRLRSLQANANDLLDQRIQIRDQDLLKDQHQGSKRLQQLLYDVLKFVTFPFELLILFSDGRNKMADDESYLDALMDALDEDENDDVLCASTDNGDVQHSVMNDEDCHRLAPSADMQEWCPSLVHQWIRGPNTRRR